MEAVGSGKVVGVGGYKRDRVMNTVSVIQQSCVNVPLKKTSFSI
jgi:hypothetical protein